ncbi:hypothetical protein ACFPRL_34325 [Pseudoclavibacter helvolus]
MRERCVGVHRPSHRGGGRFRHDPAEGLCRQRDREPARPERHRGPTKGQAAAGAGPRRRGQQRVGRAGGLAPGPSCRPRCGQLGRGDTPRAPRIVR